MPSSTSLRVGGLSAISSVDWPGELAATVWLQGCSWRCPYCHNAHLLQSGESTVSPDAPTWEQVLAFLRTRVGLLDGVVFSGGEPLAQAGLAEAIGGVRALGFRVALHTGGVSPERLAEVLPSLAWIGFDVKAPFADYQRVTRVPGSGQFAEESLRHVLAAGVALEARTTVHSALLGEKDLARMGEELAALGVRRWVLQPFREEGCADEALLAAGPQPALRVPEALADGRAGLEVLVRA